MTVHHKYLLFILLPFALASCSTDAITEYEDREITYRFEKSWDNPAYNGFNIIYKAQDDSLAEVRVDSTFTYTVILPPGELIYFTARHDNGGCRCELVIEIDGVGHAKLLTISDTRQLHYQEKVPVD